MKLTKTVPSWTDSFYEMHFFVEAIFYIMQVTGGSIMDFLRSKNVQMVFWISLGAVLGANLRYWFGVWAGQRWGTQFPLATLFINLTGSLILGFFITIATERFLLDPRWRLFFAIGFLGSYTTFSTYTYESMAMILMGNWSWGLLNLLGSSVLGGFAVFLGVILGRLM